MAKRRKRAAKRKSNPPKRRRRAAPRRANPPRRRKRRASRSVLIVANPPRRRRRSSARKRRANPPRRRRRNPSGFSSIPWKQLGIATAVGAVSIWGALQVEKAGVISQETIDDPKKSALACGLMAAAGAAALTMAKQPIAAMGVAAGLGGLALYSGAMAYKADQSTQAVYTGAVYEDPYAMGAVEVPRMRAVYADDDADGMAPVHADLFG